MPLIALCGKAGSGKSTVARYLEEAHGAERHSFALPLKRMAMDLWGFTEEQVFGSAAIKETIDPRWGITPRYAMQTLGESARQHLGKGIWVDSLIDRLCSEVTLNVIEDLRHVNEAQAVYEAGGHVVRLHYVYRESSDDGTHPSEVEVDQIPERYLAADIRSTERSLAKLYGTIDSFMSKLRR